MAKDYQKLWEHITGNGTGEAEAIRTLAEILADMAGSIFISRLNRIDAELCIEILDLVSCDPYLTPSAASDDPVRVSQSTTSNLPRRRHSSTH